LSSGGRPFPILEVQTFSGGLLSRGPFAFWSSDSSTTLVGEYLNWLRINCELGYGDDQPLFCTVKTQGGTALTTPYLRRLLPRLAKQAKPPISKRVHAHMLRHTRASELAAAGVAVNVIQVALGHLNLATTSTYLQHIAPGQVEAAMRGRT